MLNYDNDSKSGKLTTAQISNALHNDSCVIDNSHSDR